jgi:hypothetical protein
MRFFRRGKCPLKVTFDLEGDYHEDIRGMAIRIHNDQPSDRNDSLDRGGTYMEGFAPVQRGTVGDITAGIPLGPGPTNSPGSSYRDLSCSGMSTGSRGRCG